MEKRRITKLTKMAKLYCQTHYAALFYQGVIDLLVGDDSGFKPLQKYLNALPAEKRLKAIEDVKELITITGDYMECLPKELEELDDAIKVKENTNDKGKKHE